MWYSPWNNITALQIKKNHEQSNQVQGHPLSDATERIQLRNIHIS